MINSNRVKDLKFSDKYCDDNVLMKKCDLIFCSEKKLYQLSCNKLEY